MGLRLKPFLTTLLLALVTVSAPALSQDAGWFIGAGGGQSKFRDGCATFAGPGTCDDNGAFWKVFGGYQFNSFFGFEIGYADFGKNEQTTTGVGSETFDATGAEAVLVVTVPFTQDFGIYGKYGIYRWDVERVVTGPGAMSVTPTGETSRSDSAPGTISPRASRCGWSGSATRIWVTRSPAISMSTPA